MRPELPVLIKARALIADPAMWGKGRRGRDRPFATCCAAEAIEDMPYSEARRRAIVALRNAVLSHPSVERLVDWNDAPERTHAEVLAAFDKAIEGAS